MARKRPILGPIEAIWGPLEARQACRMVQPPTHHIWARGGQKRSPHFFSPFKGQPIVVVVVVVAAELFLGIKKTLIAPGARGPSRPA